MQREASFAPPISCQMLSVDLVRHVSVSDLPCCLVDIAAMASGTFHEFAMREILCSTNLIQGWRLRVISFWSIFIFAASSVINGSRRPVLPFDGGFIIISQRTLAFLVAPP